MSRKAGLNEESQSDTRKKVSDWRRTVIAGIPRQAEQIRETPAEYVARKFGIRG